MTNLAYKCPHLEIKKNKWCDRYAFNFKTLQNPVIDCNTSPDSKVHGANMGPTWVLSAPDGPHVGPMNLAIKDGLAALDVSQNNEWTLN